MFDSEDTDSGYMGKDANWKSVSIPSELILEVQETVSIHSEFKTNAEFIRRAIANLLRKYKGRS